MQENLETQTEVTTVSHEVPTKVTKTTTQMEPQVRTEHPQVVYKKKKAIFRTHQVIWYILVVVEVLLIFRVSLKALGANSFSGFTSLIYTLSDPLALPFRGILGTSVSQGSVFEWSTIIAAIVYAIIAGGLVQLMQFFKPVTPREVEETVDNQ